MRMMKEGNKTEWESFLEVFYDIDMIFFYSVLMIVDETQLFLEAEIDDWKKSD